MTVDTGCDAEAEVRPKHLVRTDTRQSSRLRRAIELAGLTYSQVARHAGIHESLVRMLVVGSRPLTIDRLETFPERVRAEYHALASDEIDERKGAGNVAGAAAIAEIERQVLEVAAICGELAREVHTACADGTVDEVERKRILKPGAKLISRVRGVLIRLEGK